MTAGGRAEVITDKDGMRRWSRNMRAQGKTIGLVPTMGYLHQGHISLITEAKYRSDLVVVSIYVNPGQFSLSEDLSSYPSDIAGDLHKLMGVVDVVFCPQDLYDYGNPCISVFSNSANDFKFSFSGRVVDSNVSCLEERECLGHETWIRVEKLEKGLCGKSRPVVFRGVATVVTKLFNIVEPDVAVFGKKDYQQWRIIERMVRDLDFPIKVIGADIVRDHDGLAMSSRNVRLSPQQRQKALSISMSLSSAKSAIEKGHTNSKELQDSIAVAIRDAGGEIDYVEIVDQVSLEGIEEIRSPVVLCVAAWFGKVRLIDNMEIDPNTSLCG